MTMQISTPLLNGSATLTTLAALLEEVPQLEESILLIILSLGIAYRANRSDRQIAMTAISLMERLIPKDSESHRNFEMQLKRALTALQVAQQPEKVQNLRDLYRHSQLANNRSEIQI